MPDDRAQTFRCAGCGRDVSVERGAADDMPEHCDDCWLAARPQLSMGRSSFKVTYPAQSKGMVSDYIEIFIENDGTLTLRGFDGRLVIRADVSNKINVALEKF